ncbi:MAG: hypothetical protein QM479_04785 [Pseudomonadota bacterium]
MKFFSLLTFLVSSLLITLTYSEPSYSEQLLDLNTFIKSGAIKDYTKNSPRYRIVTKYGAQLNQVNLYRKYAAYLAIKSDKCDFVSSSDVVGENHLEYEVICQNGAIIYLSKKVIQNNYSSKKSSIKSIITEKEKALPRAIAKSRCEQLVQN